MKRRIGPLAVLLLILSSGAALMANATDYDTADLPYVALQNGSDLQADAKLANEKQVPVLLFFSMEHCPFCVVVEEEFLKPMLRNKDYDNKVIIRQVKIDGSDFVKDFKGTSREPGEFRDDYDVSMVPTVVFVDAKGNMMSPSIRGIQNSHYYGAELDDAIDNATYKIRSLAKR